MKTNVLVKFAVVAMAAFGAYAFSGNSAEQQMYTRGDTCENITAECSNFGTKACIIIVDNALVPVLDLQCNENIMHVDSSPVDWLPIK